MVELNKVLRAHNLLVRGSRKIVDDSSRSRRHPISLSTCHAKPAITMCAHAKPQSQQVTMSHNVTACAPRLRMCILCRRTHNYVIVPEVI